MRAKITALVVAIILFAIMLVPSEAKSQIEEEPEEPPSKQLVYEFPDPCTLKDVVCEGEEPERSFITREVSAYNVGIVGQTDSSPCIGASGKNLCELLKTGIQVCAANFVPIGTKLLVEGFGECIVEDRMNSRYPQNVDVAMSENQLQEALKFGRRNLRVSIEYSNGTSER